jgi:hypothetical protein
MNNEERLMWLENDESLYLWRRQFPRLTTNQFVKQNRVEIDRHINAILNK